jgi:inorganic pyrophosphatase
MQNSDLTKLPNKLDAKQFHCRAIIETPKGARNKFNYDPESGLFRLGGFLPEGMMFPFDFGFIPSTSAGDGDPLDIMVLMDAPATTGCLIDVRLIGVIEAMQTEDGDKRVFERPVKDFSSLRQTSASEHGSFRLGRRLSFVFADN